VTDESNQTADDTTAAFAAEAEPMGHAVDHELAGRETITDIAAVSTDEAEDESVEDGGVEESIAEGPDSEESAEQEEVVEEVAESPVESKSGPVFVAPAEDDDLTMNWYILKVQSNRERSIAEAVERKIKVEGLDRYFDQVIVPTEKVTEFKGGKKKIVERKLYPGYIVVHMHINDDTWFAVRETSGVGDFTGAGGKPTPMLPHEVSKIIQTETEETQEAPKLDIKFAKGDKVKVKEGNFESFEGEVGSIDEASGRVTVMINIFGRSTPVELEYWQIEAM
jgi:transcription termination/antitermination protein NusG